MTRLFTYLHFGFGVIALCAATIGCPDERSLKIRRLESQLQAKPNSADLLIDIGNLHSDAGERSKAMLYFQRVLKHQPANFAANYNMGLEHYRGGEFQKAESFFAAAVRVRPDSSETHNLLADALRQQGKTEAAIASYRRALLLNPADLDSYRDLARLYRHSKHPDLAVSICTEGLRLKPDDGGLLHELALSHHDAGRYAKALESYHATLKTDFSDPSIVYFNMGQAYVASENTKEAEDSFRRSARLDDKDPDARLQLGWLYYRQQRYEEALEPLREGLAINADTPYLNYYAGLSLYESANVEAAVQKFSDEIGGNPLRTAGNFGTMLRAYYFLQQAVSHLESESTISKDDADVHFYLGLALLDLDESHKAVAPLETARSLRRNDKEILFHLARAHQNSGQLDTAIPLYLRAVELDKTFAGAHYNLGLIYEAKQERSRARYYYRLACRAEFKDACAQLNRK